MESFDLAVDRAQKKNRRCGFCLEAVSQRSKILKDHLARAEKNFQNALDKTKRKETKIQNIKDLKHLINIIKIIDEGE